MLITTNDDTIQKMLKNFYNLTHIKICVFDTDFNEIISYPEKYCKFCELIRQNENLNNKCIENDKCAYKKCKNLGTTYTYKCHLGLIENITPIKYNTMIIGYLMFGQLLGEKKCKKNFDKIKNQINNLDVDINKAEKYYYKLSLSDDEKIDACANILEALTCYIYMKNLIALPNDNLGKSIDDFINKNINQILSIDTLCTHFMVSRVKLYEITNKYYNKGIAQIIQEKRMNYAKKLLIEMPNETIYNIANLCGIGDYNYFTKIFKKHNKITPTEFKKSIR